MVKVPAVLMSTPPSCKAVVALTVVPCIPALQANAPVEFVTVQPVDPDPPPSRMSPVLVAPSEIVPVPLASTVRLPLPVEIAFAPTFKLLTAVAVRVPPVIVPPDTEPPLKVPPDSVPPLMVAVLIVPEQSRLPVALSMVQPVEPLPPPIMILPVEVPPIETVPVPVPSSVKPVFVPPEEIDNAPVPLIAVPLTLSELTAVAVSVPPLTVPPDSVPPDTEPPLSVPPEIVAPFKVPAHAKLPLAFVMVQPVLPLPPPSSMSPVDIPPIEIVLEPLASRVSAPVPLIAVPETFKPFTAVALKVPPVIVPPDTLPPLKVPPLRVPPEIVAPLMVPVTDRVPPIEALLVTVRPVPEPANVTPSLKVLTPPKVCIPAVTKPANEVSADCRTSAEPLITAPLVFLDCESMVPILLMALPPLLAGIQAVPFQINGTLEFCAIVTPYMEKLTLPDSEFTNTSLPEAVLVGVGNVRVWPIVVWVTSKVVATSTVVAAVPMLPPVAWLDIATALKTELPLLVKVWPVPIVKPPLKVPRPVNVPVPEKVLLPVTPRVPPKVVAPVPTVKVLEPVTAAPPLKLARPVTPKVPVKLAVELIV